ncbi:MAG TPA: sporulation protein YqfC [Firmicutes bacterium]|nr:sporulation protein YqfC [Bacillota bacterium]
MRRSPRERLARRVADLLELPKDVILDLPTATLLGNVQCIVANHRGIIEYLPERVRVNTTRGEVLITGRGLAIGSISQDEVVIEGRIAGFAFQDWAD